MLKTNASGGDPPIIFLHIPRTGGTTLRHCLEKQYARGEILRVNTARELECLQALPAAKKNHLRFLSGHIGFAFDTVLPRSFHYITLLRDPVSRVASAYQFIRATPTHTHYHIVTAHNLSLGDFIRGRISVINIDNGMTRLLSGAPNDAHDVEFGQCTTAMLEAAKKNLRERIAVLGLTEQFDASLVLMRRRFGWNSLLYTTVNATKGTRIALEPAEIALIEKHNALDRELYTFATKLFRRQLLLALPSILYQVHYFQYKNRVHKQEPDAFKRLRQFEYKRIARWLDLK